MEEVNTVNMATGIVSTVNLATGVVSAVNMASGVVTTTAGDCRTSALQLVVLSYKSWKLFDQKKKKKERERERKKEKEVKCM